MSIRREANKKKIIEQLRLNPIVTVVCRRCNISTATYYRWHIEDSDFAKAADEAQAEGTFIVNDAIESKLINLAMEGNPMLMMHWLNNRHPSYRNTKFWHARALANSDKAENAREMDRLRGIIGNLLDEPDDSIEISQDDQT